MNIQAQDLRIGNLLYLDLGDIKGIVKVSEIKKDVVWLTSLHGRMPIAYTNSALKPIPLTPEILLKAGFENIPHHTITRSMRFDLGRKRVLSIGNVGTPNEMLWLCQVNDTDKTIIDDLVCVHNYDYDGYLHLHQLQNIIYDFTNQELTIEL